MPESPVPGVLLAASAGEGDTAFDEPWQAELLAIAYSLAERGVFTRSEWSEELGASLRRANAAGAADTQATYYAAALDALETLLAGSGRITTEALTERTMSWRRAYIATPHGEPVLLAIGAAKES